MKWPVQMWCWFLHDWSRWKEVNVSLNQANMPSIVETRQMRQCERCGRTQVKGVYV